METIIWLAGVGTPALAPSIDNRAVDDLDLGSPRGLDVLQHRRLAADRAGEECGNRRPSLVVVEPDALRFGDSHYFPQNGRHRRLGVLVLDELVGEKAQTEPRSAGCRR